MIGCSTRETTEGLAGNAGVSGGLSEISAALACEEGSAVSPAQAEAQPPPSPQGAPPRGGCLPLSPQAWTRWDPNTHITGSS